MRVILVGHAASGKDYGRESLMKFGYKPSISYTSRPPRPNEVDGKDYHFVDDAKFEQLMSEDFFYEVNRFGKPVEEGGPGLWWYGTPKNSFEDCTLFIMTPSGVSKLQEKHRKSSAVIFFDIPEEIRRERLNQRKDADKAERRLATDRADFENFTDFDTRVTDAKYTPESLDELARMTWAKVMAKGYL